MTSKQHDTMLFNMDAQLHTAVSASKRACESAKQAIGKACGNTLKSALKKNGANGAH